VKYFRLLSGERIIKEIKPLPNLKFYFFFKSVIGWLFFWLFLIFFFLTSLKFSIQISILILILPIPLFYYISYLRYKQRAYWITNKRIIFKKGLFGYSINSIPLNKVSDLIISRSLLERIFGFGSLHVQSLAGQISPGTFGAEASLLAIPEPEKTQQLILQLIKKVT